jgi:hypothetical protein
MLKYYLNQAWGSDPTVYNFIRVDILNPNHLVHDSITMGKACCCQMQRTGIDDDFNPFATLYYRKGLNHGKKNRRTGSQVSLESFAH